MGLSRTPPSRRPFQTLAVVGTAGSTCYVAALTWAMAHDSFDAWGAMLLAPALLLLTWPLARLVARAEDDSRMVRLLLAALLVKLVASLVRYFVAFDVYDGVADAGSYAAEGARLAESFRRLDFVVDLGRPFIGTGFIRALTGLVFTVTGPTRLGGFLVFAWLGFWGQYSFYRAFRTAIPDGDHRRYALLVLFLPSLLFWPSSIGKEAWMLFTLGIAARGAAGVLTQRRGGYLILAAGVAGVSLVRPHMAVLVSGALVAAYLLRRGPGSLLSPITRPVGTAVLIGVTLLALQQASAFFGVDPDGAGLDEAQAVQDETARRTEQGDSSFTARQVRSPADVPPAVVNVLFRPFPHEAHNAQSLLAALESTALLVLIALGWRRWATALRQVRRHAYVGFALAYAALFTVAFSSFGNFGILVRQRVQVLPLVLVLLALPRLTPQPQPQPQEI